MRRARVTAGLAIALGGAFACGLDASGVSESPGAGAGSGDAAGGGDVTSGGGDDGANAGDDATSAIADGPLLGDAPADVDAGSFGPPLVYGTSKDALYEVNVVTQTFHRTAFAGGCPGAGIAELAQAADGTLYGASADATGLFRIDRSNASCQQRIVAGAMPGALTWLPAGVLGGSQTLVGYVGGTYFSIDVSNGSQTAIGALGGNYSVSGDVVAVQNGKMYVSVTGGPGNVCADCLVEADPVSGAVMRLVGPIPAATLGLAFWGGRVYGFVKAGGGNGYVFVIDPSLVAPVAQTIPWDASADFYGGSSPTFAPLQ